MKRFNINMALALIIPLLILAGAATAIALHGHY